MIFIIIKYKQNYNNFKLIFYIIKNIIKIII